MSYRKNARLLWSVTILIGLSGICTNWASAQSEDVEISVGIGLKDLKEIDRRLQDYEILKEIDRAKDDRIRNLEKDLAVTQKELEIEKRENEINRKTIALQEKKIEMDKENFNQMKEVADRAIKLAETTKPKSNNLLYIIGGIFVGIITGLAIAL